MDYARFLMMLRNGGQPKRYISSATLAYMTSDQVEPGGHPHPALPARPRLRLWPGFAVRTSAGEAVYPAALGEYYWGRRRRHLHKWVDPANDLFVVFSPMQSPKWRVPLSLESCANMIYGAITEAAPAIKRCRGETIRSVFSFTRRSDCGAPTKNARQAFCSVANP